MMKRILKGGKTKTPSIYDLTIAYHIINIYKGLTTWGTNS
jgi:hypothetical protein